MFTFAHLVTSSFALMSLTGVVIVEVVLKIGGTTNVLLVYFYYSYCRQRRYGVMHEGDVQTEGEGEGEREEGKEEDEAVVEVEVLRGTGDVFALIFALVGKLGV